MTPASETQKIYFKIRFNTTHGSTNLYWRIIIDEAEVLAASVHCAVPTYSESSFDKKANAEKWHMAGMCTHFTLDADNNAFFK